MHTKSAAQIDLCVWFAHIHLAGTARKQALLDLGNVSVADLEEHVANIQRCQTEDKN